MKKISILPIFILVGATSMAANAATTTTFYYDAGGVCDGLFLKNNATSCSDAIKKIRVPSVGAEKTFIGYWVGDTQVIDANGSVLIDGTDMARILSTVVSNRAIGGTVPTNEVTVMENITWRDKNNVTVTDWFVCSGVAMHECVLGGDFQTQYAPNCWKHGTQPAAGNYDYIFNSWFLPGEGYFAENKTVYNGCNGDYLGRLDSVAGDSGTYISRWRVVPFACALLDNGRKQFVSTYSDGNRTIELDNTVPGKCKYNLYCNKNDGDIDDSITCAGEDCKTYTSDYVLGRLQCASAELQ